MKEMYLYADIYADHNLSLMGFRVHPAIGIPG